MSVPLRRIVRLRLWLRRVQSAAGVAVSHPRGLGGGHGIARGLCDWHCGGVRAGGGRQGGGDQTVCRSPHWVRVHLGCGLRRRVTVRWSRCWRQRGCRGRPRGVCCCRAGRWSPRLSWGLPRTLSGPYLRCVVWCLARCRSRQFPRCLIEGRCRGGGLPRHRGRPPP